MLVCVYSQIKRVVHVVPSLTLPLENALAAAVAAKSLQSCPTLCDPIYGSPPGSPVPGILQARTLEWVAISFSNAWGNSNRITNVKVLCKLKKNSDSCANP